jgi:hypothetical protein
MMGHLLSAVKESVKESVTDEIHPSDPKSIRAKKHCQKHPGKTPLPTHDDDTEDRHQGKKDLSLAEDPKLIPGKSTKGPMTLLSNEELDQRRRRNERSDRRIVERKQVRSVNDQMQ